MKKELFHHGVKGMKWGVRRYQNADGSLTPLGREHYKVSSYSHKNLEKWGTSPDNNLLYITGYSGSGKSTLAKSLQDEKTKLIHLDQVFERANNMDTNTALDNTYFKEHLDPDLVNYIKKKKFPAEKMVDTSLGKERFKYIDEFTQDILPGYSKEQYRRGNKVIAEGVQILDSDVFADRNMLINSPIIIMNTSGNRSIKRAQVRDKTKLDSVDIEEHKEWQRYLNKRMKEIKASDMQTSKRYINAAILQLDMR